MSAALLEVRNLTVSVQRPSGRFTAVEDVSFELEAGAALGIVGESGSGKSLTLRALMSLLPSAVRVEAGTVALDGVQLPMTGSAARRARRRRMGIVLQDPLSSLDPVHTVGRQIAEVPHRILGLSRRRAWERAVELLGLVGIADSTSRARAFPHQLSGGMRQRVAIAIAIASEPELLLCDEPTTALDVTVQAQVLELIDDLRSRLGLAVVFVSHDLAVVRQLCENVAVMYAGRIAETGPTERVLERPAHPYTLGLRNAVIDLDEPVGPPRPIRGALPDVSAIPPGCPFHPRCDLATGECSAARPELTRILVPGVIGSTACIHHERLIEEAA